MNKRGDFFKNPYTIVLTILVLFVILVIFTLLIKPPVQEQELKETETQEECKFCNDIIQTNIAGVKNDIEECNKLSSPEAIDFCKTSMIMDKAMNEKDLTICNQLSNEKITICKNNVYLVQALDGKDKNICNNILNEDTKNLCLNSI